MIRIVELGKALFGHDDLGDSIVESRALLLEELDRIAVRFGPKAQEEVKKIRTGEWKLTDLQGPPHSDRAQQRTPKD